MGRRARGGPHLMRVSRSGRRTRTKRLCSAHPSATAVSPRSEESGKRRIVLERIALEFEPGTRYDEREVNAIVGAFFNDHTALRRYLVDEGFLDRTAGVYWRASGRVDV
jgi:hypothetical protein